MKPRAKKLTDDRVRAIISIIDNWGGKLSWPLLIASIARQMRETYTRQALFGHDEIALAFTTKKKLLRGNPREEETSRSPEMRAALAEIASLKATVERQAIVIQTLKEQFVRFTYNASIANLTLAFLDRPLPRVDRGQTPCNKGSNKR